MSLSEKLKIIQMDVENFKEISYWMKLIQYRHSESRHGESSFEMKWCESNADVCNTNLQCIYLLNIDALGLYNIQKRPQYANDGN